MKLKISVSLSTQAIELIDALPNKPARSEIIEEALILYFKNRQILARDKSDLHILNSQGESLNKEALDVLRYQTSGKK